MELYKIEKAADGEHFIFYEPADSDSPGREDAAQPYNSPEADGWVCHVRATAGKVSRVFLGHAQLGAAGRTDLETVKVLIPPAAAGSGGANPGLAITELLSSEAVSKLFEGAPIEKSGATPDHKLAEGPQLALKILKSIIDPYLHATAHKFLLENFRPVKFHRRKYLPPHIVRQRELRRQSGRLSRKLLWGGLIGLILLLGGALLLVS